LFPTNAVIEEFKDELKKYSLSKGTIQFPVDKPLPAALVKKLVKARVRRNESAKKRRRLAVDEPGVVGPKPRCWYYSKAV
jgi:uncharacterized protein YdhG (YjbR/CyaY superfamily)